MRQLPMFPLGTVLLPHMVLPLHVFEPRYRQLVRDVLASDREFGVVLIERGHEVGGGDVRTDRGTVARVLQTEELEDGRWLLVTLGTRRFRVVRWLPDDPYPRAEVEDLAEPPTVAGDAELRDRVAGRLRRVLALRAELDEPAAPATTDIERDPAVASYQMAVLAALGPLDAQRVLAATDATQRLEQLDATLAETADLLSFRLGPGPADPHEDGG